MITDLGSQEALKDVVNVARWRVLAHGRYTMREVDLILGAGGLMKLLTLMSESRKKFRILFAGSLWVRFPY